MFCNTNKFFLIYLKTRLQTPNKNNTQGLKIFHPILLQGGSITVRNKICS